MAGPKVETWKKNVQLTEMDIDETKRKLRGAYQEAEKCESLFSYNHHFFILCGNGISLSSL